MGEQGVFLYNESTCWRAMSASRIRAPELPDNLEWFNTDEPVRLAEQPGKVVLLDFWTYSSITCLHTLPDLAWLRRKYGDRLMVIGIHSPKFSTERDSASLQKAINRHYIRHPVLNDPELRLWKKYAIKSWPSLIFIDPEGYIVGVLRGEGRRKQLDQMIEKALKQADDKGLQPKTVFTPSVKHEPATELKFPGRLIVKGERLFVADTGHNRVLECMTNGRVVRAFGGGTPGLVDGNRTEASFDSPQGMCIVAGHLYVADTGNHVIRKIDLTTYDVETVAGTGKQGKLAEEGKSWRDPLQANLNSPWDVAYHNRVLYIAMAGCHQVWMLDLTSEHLSLYTGTGREDLVEGGPGYACFAEPTSIVSGEDIEPVLFTCDAQSSAVRAIRFRDVYARTLIGTGLFDFGDRDGKGREARLQHPMSISYDAQRKGLWIADTLNNKIKFLNLTQQEVTTLKIDYELAEPAGLSVTGDTLFVVNTNAHQILAIDLNTRNVEEIEIFSVNSD
jgi:thiol-disulfide isomerase/thioredoxin